MATKKTVKASAARVRRPKAEVEQEFESIQDELRAARELADPKADDLARQKNDEVRRAVEGATVDAVVEQISRLGLDVTRALNGISEKLVEEVNRLATLRQAVELEREELSRLHKIDVAATALDQLIQEYESKKAELEAEISGQREEWEASVAAAERERKEQEEALKKQRQREIDDYEYKKNLERKRAQDKYDEEIRLTEKRNAEKQEELEKSWARREAELAEREQELARLRKEAAEFPATLERETKNAAAQASRDARAEAERQTALLKKEMEADRRVAELQIKTLEELVARQTAQIAEMQKQLEEAKRQVQEIAVRAIEGASGARALAHVNEIAIEQAKHRQQP